MIIGINLNNFNLKNVGFFFFLFNCRIRSAILSLVNS